MKMISFEKIFRSFLLSVTLLGSFSNGQILKFLDCSLDDYYGGLSSDQSSWTRDELQSLLYLTHRNNVEFTNSIDPGIDDVWGALIDVDEGIEPGTVSLIYSSDDELLPSIPFGETSWVRDHLFPILRGVDRQGPDLTDIHAIRPATALSNFVAGDKFFGVCKVLTTSPEQCISPAEGAASDTCVCERIFEPPTSKKGDIARALMYMDLRYDGNEPDTLDLRLTDCPFEAERDMAYLSQIITWHKEDPPDDAEMTRNLRTCAYWQGNRNPFIDYPDLVDVLFPQPSTLPDIGPLIYEKCESIPTLPPTFVNNECDLLPEGDIVPFLINSGEGKSSSTTTSGEEETPDVESLGLSLGLYSFSPMEVGFELFLTDNPWDGATFLELNTTTDGTIKFVAPLGFSGGDLFGFGLGSSTSQSYEDKFEIVQGNLTLSTEGEPLWIYCMSASGLPRPITLFNNGGNLTDPFLNTYQDGESALPEGFPEEGIINLKHYDNMLFEGPQDATTDVLKAAIRDPKYWKGSNDEEFQLSRTGSSSSSGAAATTGTTMFAKKNISLLVLVVCSYILSLQ